MAADAEEMGGVPQLHGRGVAGGAADSLSALHELREVEHVRPFFIVVVAGKAIDPL
jgi:hypothetical protein